MSDRRSSRLARAAAITLAVLYALAALAPFLSPYGESSMDRGRFYHPPQRVHWVDAAGRLHLRPFVYATRLAGPEWSYTEDRAHPAPLRWWVRGERYTLAPGWVSDRHLFGLDQG